MPPDGYAPLKADGVPEPEENTRSEYRLVQALSRLAHEIRESRKVSAAQLEWFQQQDNWEKQNNKLDKLEKIMASVQEQLDEFASDVETKFGEIGTKVDAVVSSVSGLSGDIATLKRQIDEAIASGGDLNQATKDRLAAIRATGAAIAQKVTVAAQIAAEADALTAESPTPV